ncbi:MAG: branched-chain amino acid ABC transporter permease [Alphaproteobacteria bacterium]|nr:branched-chain amino acid ABC transporter permease [Alphaproteobacteria bacterium]
MAGLDRRAVTLLALLLIGLLFVPAVAGPYLLSIMILVLYFAYVGQAWNVMMGMAGQLSLGHSLYVGLGAYVAAALFVHAGIGPWIGALAAMAVATLAGAVIGYLAFRFRVGGVYFALLTIAFAEFTRIGFDHMTWLGGSAGLFLPVAQRERNDLWSLRGDPVMFYYVILGMAVTALALCRHLARSRIGFYWRAIREDPVAAEALGIDVFRYKMLAAMASSAMTAPAGVFFAFYYNNLFPEQIFSMLRSIELILGPIIGGLGTLFGPVLGAFVLTILAEALQEALQTLGWQIPGIKQVFYGFCLLLVIVFLPNGIWPPLARRLGLDVR